MVEFKKLSLPALSAAIRESVIASQFHTVFEEMTGALLHPVHFAALMFREAANDC